MNCLDLGGKVALVTGGGSGIGRGICLKLAEHGAAVAVVDLNLPGAAETVVQLKSFKIKAEAFQADVSKSSDVKRVVNDIIKSFGQIDILCNNAGISLIRDTIDLDEADWDRHMNINAKGVFLFSREVAPGMIKRGQGGRIINTASYLGKIAAPGLSHYCASKFAVVGFTQSLAVELGKYRITVNAVCPGDVDTPMMDREWVMHAESQGITPAEAKEANRKRMLLGRLEKPEDIGRLVVFLASEYGEYITAECINVSGGLPFISREA
jgi:NAD(P)-dependent dehydrogenase (short-subunit alcohol dehydrogenase family)